MNTSNPNPFPINVNGNEVLINNDVIVQVRHLSEMVSDALEGIKTAREDVNDGFLASMFDDIHAMHDRHYTEIADMLTRYRQEPEDSGTVAGQLHRTWMDLKAAATDGDPEAILESVKFGEQKLEAAYADTLNDITFPSALESDQSILAQQRNDILEVIDKIGALQTEHAN